MMRSPCILAALRLRRHRADPGPRRPAGRPCAPTPPTPTAASPWATCSTAPGAAARRGRRHRARARALVLDAGRVQALARANGLDWANAAGHAPHHRPRRRRRPAPRPASLRAPATLEVLTYARSIAAGEIVQPQDLVWAKAAAAPGRRPARPRRGDRQGRQAPAARRRRRGHARRLRPAGDQARTRSITVTYAGRRRRA